MTIHVVQNGETINSIADKYGEPADRIILDNGIKYPNRLVVGEAIVILHPKTTYIIQEGDNLAKIAEKYGVTVEQLLRNNPFLSDREYIYPGEMVVINYEGDKIRTIATNGYAFPFINRSILRKTLPFLTYLTIFSYKVTAEGEINDIDDKEIIQEAKVYGVASIMMVESLSQSMEEEISVIHSILTSQEKQDLLFNNILRILQEKGYSGVNINTPYILPVDRNLYEEFILQFADYISKAGYKVYNSFSIRIFQLMTGTIFTGLEYSKIGQELDGITLITYGAGYSEGIPPGTTSIDTFRRFFEYATKVIPPEKTYLGISVQGYVWKYPYIPGISKGMVVSYDSAITIAMENNAEILYDEITSSAYFQYIAGDEFIVRFWDARSIDSFIKMVPDFGLIGTGIWNIMTWFPQMWLVINAQYEIEKVI